MCRIGSMFFKMAIFAAILAILTGCNSYNGITVNASANQPVNISTWITYWDLDEGVKDLAKMGKKIEKLIYFSAYFDQNDQIIIPQELSNIKTKFKNKNKGNAYLSFVNDRQNADESFVAKDIEILRRLFANDDSMKRHIDDVVALTLQGGYDGIEIDYEKIWKDKEVSQSFFIFINRLYLEVLKNNLKLRVVLEPGTPFYTAAFAKGPEYVVMFYNFYGLHSQPGPKANRDFIKKLLAQMQFLPGEKSVAFATGGCLWGDNGEKKLLTEMEAKTLVAKYDVDEERDEESQCVVFKYKDNDVWYQVWYADVKTLSYWISIIKEQGEYNVSLWRLGGNANIGKIK